MTRELILEWLPPEAPVLCAPAGYRVYEKGEHLLVHEWRNGSWRDLPTGGPVNPLVVELMRMASMGERAAADAKR